jgi:hypothetical protein
MSVKVCCLKMSSLTPSVYKQQRARQLNDGTFERRTHKGFEGATAKADKGELFGVHNIFRYDPAGYVKGNVSSFTSGSTTATDFSLNVSVLRKQNCGRTLSSKSMIPTLTMMR